MWQIVVGLCVSLLLTSHWTRNICSLGMIVLYLLWYTLNYSYKHRERIPKWRINTDTHYIYLYIDQIYYDDINSVWQWLCNAIYFPNQPKSNLINTNVRWIQSFSILMITNRDKFNKIKMLENWALIMIRDKFRHLIELGLVKVDDFYGTWNPINMNLIWFSKKKEFNTSILL